MRALTLLRIVLAGSLRQDRLRASLAVLAIALGVALGFAVQMINGTAVNELELSVQTLAGEADLQVRGPRLGFDEAIYPEVARRTDIAAASPVVEVDARIVGRDEVLHVVGIDLFRAAAIQPAVLPSAPDRLDVLRPDAIFLSVAAAQALHARPGETIALQSGGDEVVLRIAGTLNATIDQQLAVMDIAGAQQGFHRVGRLSRIDVRVRPGFDVDAVARALASALPAGVMAARPQSTVAASARVSRAYRVNLDVLALVALFTGGLLVFSTQVLSVVRRRTQLALMRVLGLTRRELVMLLMAEGAMLGVIGSALGLVLGLGLATVALRLVGADLGSGYFRGVVPRVAFDTAQAAIFFGIGIVTAIAGTAAPALEAVRAAPAQALKAGDEQRVFARVRPSMPALIVLGLGALATLAPPLFDLPILGYVSIGLLLIGTLMLLPRIAGLAWHHAPALGRAPMRLALEQLRGAPGQASVSLAAMVASLSLMVSMGIMVHSFRDSLATWLEHVLPADIYVRAAPAGDTGYLPEAIQAQITAAPGVRRVDFIREQQLLMSPTRPRIVMLARDIDRSDPDTLLALVQTAPSDTLRAPPVWINEPAAANYGWHVGDVIELPLAGRNVGFAVAGIWRDYARQQGAVIIERSRYVALTGDREATNAAIWIAKGADIDRVRGALGARLSGIGQLEIALPEEIRQASLQAFDRTFAVTYALELAAVLIGLVGLSSAFGALVLARRREFGMLRHVGMLRRQVAGMLATEGLLVSGIGTAVGVMLGWAMSLVLIHVVNRQSFHWGMELSMPWMSLVIMVVLVTGLSMLTAVVSGRAAMSADAVRAVREDW